jgi:glycosyltransferase involved in cell wall biosynthesis
MPEVLFIVQVPSPQLSPSLDAMHQRRVSVAAAYYAATDSKRGWGEVIPEHPYSVIPSGKVSSWLFLARKVFDPELRVLCCFGYHKTASCVAVLLARARRVRVVTRSDSNWLHERLRPRVRTYLKKSLLGLVLGRQVRVWAVGSQNDRYWSEFGMTNRCTIPFSLPRAPIGTPAQRSAFRQRHDLGPGMVSLYVGVLEAWKGVDILLSAFRALPDSSARLVVVGQGSMSGLVTDAAAADPRIVYTGPLAQDQLDAAYAGADLLVLPSRRDAWGLVVDEAQANGLRVVVSDMVGCAVDRVRPGNGWIFRTGDATDLTGSLAAAVAQHKAGWPPLPAVAQHESGWPPLPATGSRDETSEMIADLVRLGVTPPGVLQAFRMQDHHPEDCAQH